MKKAALLMLVPAAATLLVLTILMASPPPTIEITNGGNQSESYAPGEAALRATIDQETGEITVGMSRSSAPLDAETANALRRDTEGLKQVIHPDGSVSVNLQGRFQSVMVVHVDDDGNVVICTDDQDHAVDALNKQRPADVSEQAKTPEVR